MKSLHALFLVCMAALGLLSGEAAAQCSGNIYGFCADCTTPTPCCGYGPCNIFCGNCDGGCRHPPDGGGQRDPSCGTTTGNDLQKALHEAEVLPVSEEDAKAQRARFDQIDANHDGVISPSETQAWAKKAKKGMSRKDIREGFDKADANGNGKIEPGEFDRSLEPRRESDPKPPH